MKIILFNSYFAHKRNPKKKTSPLFLVTFGTFGEGNARPPKANSLQPQPFFHDPWASSSKSGKCITTKP
jgi:hypothetical protein